MTIARSFALLTGFGILSAGTYTAFKPRFLPFRHVDYVIVDYKGRHFDKLFRDRESTLDQKAYFQHNSSNFGRLPTVFSSSKTASGCAIQETSLWKTAVSEFAKLNSTVRADICLQGTGSRGGDCSGGTCYQTYCADAGPGCSNGVANCGCSESAGCS